MHLKNIEKSYQVGTGFVKVLQDVSFDVEAGEFLAIMGPSGSGKSTLINIIGFLDQKFQGDYQFEGQNISQVPGKVSAKLRNTNVGFIFQNFKLITNLSVRENVALPLLYAGKERHLVWPIVSKMLEQVGLSGADNKKPGELSGGQQQRVAVARALIAQPNFLIADEPTGALDSVTSAEIIALFKEINKKFGTTVIIVTHDPNVAQQSNRIIRILDGKLVADEEVQHAD